MRAALARVAVTTASLSLSACEPSGADPAAFSAQDNTEIAEQSVDLSLPKEQRELDITLLSLALEFDGYLGVAIHDIERGRLVHHNGERMFPQQSLSKLWVALAALQKVDAGELDLAERVSVYRSDLTVFHQPIRKIVRARGVFRSDYADLMRRAITASDNTANDMLLKRVGGPSGVRNAISTAGLGAIRFGPGEREMQSALAGLEWDPSYSYGKRFFEARKLVSNVERKAAFDAYVSDPVDGASPNAIALTLGRLANGELLKAETTALFLGLLDDVKSGPNRLKGGVPPRWSIGHKTGTGQVLDIVPPGVIGEQAGYNDAGILTAPDGQRYAIAVMIGRTAAPVPKRMELMHAIVAATVSYHYAVKGQRVPPEMVPTPES